MCTSAENLLCFFFSSLSSFVHSTASWTMRTLKLITMHEHVAFFNAKDALVFRIHLSCCCFCCCCKVACALIQCAATKNQRGERKKMKISKLCAIVFIKCTSQRGSCRIIHTQYPHSVYCLGTLRCSSHSSSILLDAASLFLSFFDTLWAFEATQNSSMLNWKFQQKSTDWKDWQIYISPIFFVSFDKFEATKDLSAMTKPCGHTKQDADKNRPKNWMWQFLC